MGPFMYRRCVHWGAKWIDRIICRDAVWINSCTIHLNKQGSSCNGNLSFDPMDDIMICCALLSQTQCDIELSCFHLLQLEKFKNYDFGRCPRVYCCGQPCLPAGQSDIPRSSTVKIYCPKCEELHYPRSKHQGSILLINFVIILVYDISIILFTSAEWRVALLFAMAFMFSILHANSLVPLLLASIPAFFWQTLLGKHSLVDVCYSVAITCPCTSFTLRRHRWSVLRDDIPSSFPDDIPTLEAAEAVTAIHPKSLRLQTSQEVMTELYIQQKHPFT